MKLYQLIKDLQGEGATKALTHLITLDTLITQLENYVSESDNEARAWDITVRYKDALKETLTLGAFFPCDGSGNPLDKPIKIGMGIAEGAYNRAKVDYHVALKKVIFKGFKRIEGWNTGIENENGFKIWTTANQVLMCCDGGGTGVYDTFKELARATKDSPFELEI